MIALIVLAVMIVSVGLGFGIDFAYSVWYINKHTEAFDVSSKPIDENEIVVMSYNIRLATGDLYTEHRWRYRAPLVLRVIENNMPDILGVQEMKKIQENHFEKYLVGYGSYTPYRSKGVSAEACGIYYNESRFELLDKGVFFLSETPDKQSIGWDAEFPRICSWVRLKDKNGKEIYVFNTHLDHKGKIARIESIKLINDKINEFEAKNVILLGDFNFSEKPKKEEETDPYKYVITLFTDSKYADGVNVLKAGDTFNSYGRKNLNGFYIIDFILFKSTDLKAKSYEVVDTKIDGQYPSDHYPVKTVFKYD